MKCKHVHFGLAIYINALKHIPTYIHIYIYTYIYIYIYIYIYTCIYAKYVCVYMYMYFRHVRIVRIVYSIIIRYVIALVQVLTSR